MKKIEIVGIGWSSFVKQNNSNLPPSLKIKVYNQCILSILTYGSETQSLKKVWNKGEGGE